MPLLPTRSAYHRARLACGFFPRSLPHQVTKAQSDKREYKGLVLANGLRVLLVRDKDTVKPAAAMAVGVGAGADPAHLPGLAHFTEHMSMQGSDRYPEDNAYKQ